MVMTYGVRREHVVFLQGGATSKFGIIQLRGTNEYPSVFSIFPSLRVGERSTPRAERAHDSILLLSRIRSNFGIAIASRDAKPALRRVPSRQGRKTLLQEGGKNIFFSSF